MSQTTYCTNCGKEITATARFCRFCGTPVRKSQSYSSPPETTPHREDSPTPVTFSPPTREEAETVPESILNSLYARKRKKQIKSELKQLLNEIDELDKKVEIGLIDEEEKKKKIDSLQTIMVKLQEEQKTLEPQPLELEVLVEEEKLWRKRLEKLEETNRAQTVTKEVYASLRDEYATELAKAQSKASSEERKARRWLISLQRDTRELESEMERLRVKGEIEGKSSDEIQQELEKNNEEFKKKSIAAETLMEALKGV